MVTRCSTSRRTPERPFVYNEHMSIAETFEEVVAPGPAVSVGLPRRATTPRILVVEDEASYVEALTIGLDREGFEVFVAKDGAEAIAKFDQCLPDAVLLDVMLPGMSGIDVCRVLRSKSTSVAIVMVTARSSEIDVVLGLELGADDYVTKPYRMRELVARMRAVMRRGIGTTSEEPSDDVLHVGSVRLDLERHELQVSGSVVAIPLKEFELLEALMVRAGRVLTRDQLIDRVWGDDYVGDTKTLDVHIKRLRARIESDPANPTCITTIRGVGYRYELTAA
jgi:two-component system, OmpR family, response regulator RegX3